MRFTDLFRKHGRGAKLASKIGALLLALSIGIPAAGAYAEVSFTKDVPVVKTAPMGKQSVPTEVKVDELKKYKLSELKAVPAKDLVTTLEAIKWYQITDLFSGSEDAVAFFSDQERVKTLLTAIESKGKTFTATDDMGLPTLMEVVRAGLYLEFKNEKVTILKADSTTQSFYNAVLAVQSNNNFALGTNVQDGIVSSLGLLLWDGKTNDVIINNATKVVKQYRENMEKYSTEKNKEDAVFNTLRGVEYGLSITTSKKTEKSHPAYKKIDNFNAEIAKLALVKNYDKKTVWAPKNALFVLPTLGKFDSNETNSLKVITEAMNTNPRQEEVSLYAAKLIVERYGSIDFDGHTVDIAHLKELAIDKYMPNTYTFNNGTFVIHAGDKIPYDKIKRLYWAANEVSAQFFRTYGWDQPLEKNHKDDVLTIYLYNSPEEYKMNFHLNDIDPNNGGMYIEEEGVFYTYERTTEESRYTIEELFRHEYTHFLQARYAEKGFWWQTDLYANERLTWYDEGGAESFAGSTRTKGVVQRKTMVDYLFRDKANVFNLNDTLHASYNNGSAFYKYAYAFVSYLRENDKDTFDRLNTIIESDDVVAFDKLIKELSENADLNTKFQAYMEKLIAGKDALTVPLVADDYVAKHAFKASNEIYTDVAKSLNLKDVKVEEKAANTFNTFTLRGKYTGPASEGKAKDWYTMDGIANKALLDLEKLPWSGYKTLTCYFVNHGVNKAGQFEYEVVFRGLLPIKTVKQAPIASIKAPAVANANQAIVFNKKGSFDPDGTIQTYAWNFGDGTGSNTANPSHTYKKPGLYTVTLSVKDNDQLTRTSSVNVKVISAVGGHKLFATLNMDQEPNDDIKSATPIQIGEIVKSGMDMNDFTDTFSFEIKKAGKTTINVDNYQDFGIYWLLFTDKNSNQPIKFPNTTGKLLSGTIDLKPGKYYLRVYKYSNSYGLYNFTVNQK